MPNCIHRQHSAQSRLGGLNRSPQRFDDGGCDGEAELWFKRGPEDSFAVTRATGHGEAENRCRFWLAIVAGRTSEDAGRDAGVAPAVGSRWYREAGGMARSLRADPMRDDAGNHLQLSPGRIRRWFARGSVRLLQLLNHALQRLRSRVIYTILTRGWRVRVRIVACVTSPPRPFHGAVGGGRPRWAGGILDGRIWQGTAPGEFANGLECLVERDLAFRDPEITRAQTIADREQECGFPALAVDAILADHARPSFRAQERRR